MSSFEQTRLRAPICITWQITHKCNLQCIHCLAGDGVAEFPELSQNQIKDFLDDLAEMKVFYVNVGGGEPLLHPHFFEIVDYAATKGVYLQFSTNGTLIDEWTAREITKRELRVQVSLDGWNSSVNDAIRGSGTFEQALNAIRLLHEHRVKLAVNCVVTKSTVEGLDRMYQLVTSNGANLRLSRLRPSGRANRLWRELAPSKVQYLELYQWLKVHPEVTTGDSFFFLSALGEPLPGLSYCGAGRLTCSVDPQGLVYPCPFTTDPELAVGNVLLKPLSQVWRESELFNSLQHGQPVECQGCVSYLKCRGGCRGASYSVYADWNKPDPECMRGDIHGQSSLQ